MRAEGLPFTSTPNSDRHDLRVATHLYLNHIGGKQRNGGTVAANGPGLDAARARKLLGDAKAAELRLARKTGEVVAIADVVELVGAHVTACRAKLLAIPTRCAPQLSAAGGAAEFQQILQLVIVDALSELGNGGFGEA
jgi:hypothetical protein